MIITDLERHIYSPYTPLKEAIRDLYRYTNTMCFVCDDQRKLLGILTLGDIKHAIIHGADPLSPVKTIMNTEFTSALDTDSEEHMQALSERSNPYGTGKLERIPILDSNRTLMSFFSSTQDDTAQVHRTVLITGGAGYVGSCLSRELLDKGYDVVVLDRLMFGHEPIEDLKSHERFKLIVGDINHLGNLLDAITHVDHVIHLAGIVGDPASSYNPLRTLESNQFASKSLIDLSKYYQVSRFIFASSCSVYGADDDLLDESSSLNPLSLYARSKIFTENDLSQIADEYFHPVVLRFATLYGLSPRMRFDLVVNKMTADAYFKKKITVMGGSQWRPLLHVQDVVQAIVRSMEAPIERVSNKVFNVGSSEENYTIHDIAKTIQQLIPACEIHIKESSGEARNYRVSFDKIRDTLGFSPSFKLVEGVAHIIEQMHKGAFQDYESDIYHNFNHLRNNN